MYVALHLSSTMIRKHARLIFIALALTITTSVLFCLVANYIVNSGKLIELINDNTSDIHVHYSSCSGSMLTKFKFKDLAVDGQDSNVKWRIRIKEAAISPSIWRLPLRKFYTSVLLGDGFSFNLEFKNNKDNGFDANSYKDNWRLWFGRIELRNISEIAIGKIVYRGTGNASLDSDFYFWPEYELQIGSSRLQTFETNFKTDFRFEFERVRFHDSPGLTFLKGLSSNLKFKGESQDLSFLNYYFRSVPWLKIHGSGARLNLDMTIEKGIVNPSSTAAFEVKDLALKVGPVSAAGSGTVNYKASRLDVHFNDYRILPFALRGKRLDFSAISKKVDLVDPLANLELLFDVSPLKIARPSEFNRYLDGFKSLKLQRGSIELAASLRLSTADSKILGTVNGKAKNLVLKISGSTIETNAKLAANFGEKTSDIRLDLSHLELSGYVHRGATQVQDWWGHLRANDARLSLGKNNVLSGDIKLTARDGKPFLLALLNAGVLPADMTTLSSMRELVATSSVSIKPNSTQFTDFRLHSSTLKAQGHLELKNGTKHGLLKIDHPLRKFEVEFK